MLLVKLNIEIIANVWSINVKIIIMPKLDKPISDWPTLHKLSALTSTQKL